MLIDAESFPNETIVDADVAVVGAGPTGIVLALELERAGYRVALVEGGGTRYTPQAQALNETDHYDPARHAPMSECTRRQIGGASVIWGGRCVPFDPVDFDDRPYIPHSSWPLRYEDLSGYFPKACEYHFCGRAEFNITDLPDVEQVSIVPGLPDGDVLSSTLERWSLPTSFGKEYARALNRSQRIQLIHGLNCTEIECDDAGSRVHGIRGRTLGGRTIQIRARKYAIASGGLGTTRLLLASNRQQSDGIGNHAGHLGRFYMGHVCGEIARVRFTTPPWQTAFGFDRDSDGVYVCRRFSFSSRFLHERRLANIVCYATNPPIYDPAHGNGILSFAYLALSSPLFGKRFASEAIRKAAIGNGHNGAVWPHVRNMLRDLPATLAFVPTFGYKRFLAWRKVPGFYQFSKSNTYTLHYNCEHLPNPDSRVTLADETDGVGLRKLRIDLRYSQQDVDHVVHAHRYLDDHLRAHGRGHLEYLDDDPQAAVWTQAHHGFHQAGTTRMSADPADGVVGPDGDVDGFDDLFVASSSTFVTSGQAGSTFLAVVLALRLAEHLKRLLGATSSRLSSENVASVMDVQRARVQ